MFALRKSLVDRADSRCAHPQLLGTGNCLSSPLGLLVGNLLQVHHRRNCKGGKMGLIS